MWNLKKSPQIIRNVEGEIGMYYDAGYFTYEYEVGDYEILVNPVVSLSSISSILLVPSIISPVAKYFEKLNFISGLFLFISST